MQYMSHEQRQPVSREQIKTEIAKLDQLLKKGWVSFPDFKKHTGISKRAVLNHYDSWSDACREAGTKSGPTRENLKPPKSYSKEVCTAEMLRIAKLIAPRKLSQNAFKEHASFGLRPIYRHWGTFKKALDDLGLEASEHIYSPIPLQELAVEFLRTTIELRRIPSLRHVARRSTHNERHFWEKHGSYAGFRQAAIALLFASGEAMPAETEVLLRAELARLQEGEVNKNAAPVSPHQHGRVLGFRSFAYAPTYEQEVVGIFNAIADELGFEILCNRNEFPDCQARRRVPGARERYKDCLIEFELRSGDFRTHGHPADGCQLIVCWEHNWPDCPVEVLELSKAIKKLPGWK